MSLWGVTPRQSIEALCEREGRAHVATACIRLLRGEDAEPSVVAALGGPTAPRFLDASLGQRYWLKVWGARGLLWAWDDSAADAIVTALADDAWRVREMAAKVVARHRVDPALEAVAALQNDPSLRVREAAARALRRLTGEG